MKLVIYLQTIVLNLNHPRQPDNMIKGLSWLQNVLSVLFVQKSIRYMRVQDSILGIFMNVRKLVLQLNYTVTVSIQAMVFGISKRQIALYKKNTILNCTSLLHMCNETL